MRSMPAFSLLTPMPGLPWYLQPFWPLVFWRIQRLKARFRAAGGPGSQMLWGVMWNGRVPGARRGCGGISHRIAIAPQQDQAQAQGGSGSVPSPTPGPYLHRITLTPPKRPYRRRKHLPLILDSPDHLCHLDR